MKADSELCQCGKPAALLGQCRDCFARATQAAHEPGLVDAATVVDPGSHSGAGSLCRPGDRLGGGRFTLVEILGQGGMGTVWLANDEQLSADGVPVQVALKFISSGGPTDAELVGLLRKEVRASLRLSHPNIVRVHSWHEHPGEPVFYSMEYLPGLDLKRLLEQQPLGRFTGKQLEPLLEQLLTALEYAHQQVGIVHRDLKPANLLVTPEGQLKLTDFGLARGNATGDVLATTRGGTLLYSSPQQRAGAAPKVTDDIYSLGAVLYHLLTGKPPHSGEALSGDQPLPNPLHPWNLLGRDERRNVSAEGAATLLRCLSQEPEDRPPDVATFRRWWRSGPPVEAAPRTILDRVLASTQSALSLLWLFLIVGIATLFVVWMVGGVDTIAKSSPALAAQLKAIEQVLKKFTGGTGPNPGRKMEKSKEGDTTPKEQPPSPLTNVVKTWSLVVRVNTPKGAVSLEIRTNAIPGVPSEGDPLQFATINSGETQVFTNLTAGRYSVEAGNGPRMDPTGWVRQIVSVSASNQPDVMLDLHPSEPVIYLSHTNEFTLRDPWGQIIGMRGLEFTLRKPPPNVSAPIRADLPDRYRKKLLPGTYRLIFSPDRLRENRVLAPESDELELVPGSFTNFIILNRWKVPRLDSPWTSQSGFHLLPCLPAGSFLGSETEVTVEQFDKVATMAGFADFPLESVTKSGWTNLNRTWRTAFPEQSGTNPVVGVSWHDATNFCGWLTEKERRMGMLGPRQRYALPTAAQWSSMAGTNTWPWGESYPPALADGNYAGQELVAADWPPSWTAPNFLLPYTDRESVHTAPVGTYRANARGFRDLGGNVAEWCADEYRPDMNNLDAWAVPSTRLRSPPEGRSYRVVRGGSWYDHNDRDLLKTSAHWAELPDTRNDRIGFRVVLVEDP